MIVAISIPELESLLKDVLRASRVLQYYPSGHPQILAALGEALCRLEEAVRVEKELLLGVKENGLYVGTHLVLPFVRKDGPLGRNLFEIGIKEIALLSGVEVGELVEFLEYVAQDPRQIWNHGGVSGATQKKKWQHIRISGREFAIGDGEALVEATAGELQHEDLEKVARSIVAWSREGWKQLAVTELVRIMAAVDRTGSFKDLISTSGEEDAPSDMVLINIIGQTWSSLATVDHDFETSEMIMLEELLKLGPKALLEAFQGEQKGEVSLHRLIDRIDGVVLGERVGQQIITRVADASEWLNVLPEMGRTRSRRKQILYGCLGSLQAFPDAPEVLGVVEAAMRESGREENAFLALLRGSSLDTLILPESWQKRCEVAPLIRYAIDLAGRMGVPKATRIRWARVELERLMGDEDADGVLELLSGIVDDPDSDRAAASVQIVSDKAIQLMPRYLDGLKKDQRSRFFERFAAVEKQWKELVTYVLDASEHRTAQELREDMEAAGIDVREMLVDVLRNEDPEVIASAARVLASVGVSEDRDILFPLLHHGNHRVRIEIIRLLADMAPDELAKRIPKVVEDPNPMVVRELLAHMKELPGVVTELVQHARTGWLRSVADDIAIEVLRLVSQNGTESEKAEIAALVRTQSFSGKVASPRVREMAKRLLEM